MGQISSLFPFFVIATMLETYEYQTDLKLPLCHLWTRKVYLKPQRHLSIAATSPLAPAVNPHQLRPRTVPRECIVPEQSEVGQDPFCLCVCLGGYGARFLTAHCQLIYFRFCPNQHTNVLLCVLQSVTISCNILPVSPVTFLPNT